MALEDDSNDVPITESRDTVKEGAGSPLKRRSRLLAQGNVIGRYVVIKPLGEGGMGTVVLAYDPELDRKIALKLFRAANEVGIDPAEAQRRLLREAQAIARLRHSNVIAIHDVGKHDDQVFIALDYVEGATIRQWLRAAVRTPREIVAAYVQAGHGLAAAHRAGLVHRDFKPDNVLVGTDGRVFVTDFGLARLADDQAPSEEGVAATAADHRVGVDLLASPLTELGALVGTPGYMAPEQYRGERGDARSDQFAFCASLYAALHGTRAFAGKTSDEIREQVLVGNVAAPLRTDAPARIRQILLRGLRGNPAERFPSMDALLAELERDRVSRKRRIAAAAALVVGIGCLAVAFELHGRSGPCEGTEDSLAGAWDPAIRAAVHMRFNLVGGAQAVRSLDIVDRLLDRYVSDWGSQQIGACKDTRVRGVQTENVMTLRMICLDDHLKAMRATITLLQAADAGIVDKAPSAVASLAPPAECADTGALTSILPIPADPKVRAEVSESRTQLAKAQALMLVGKFAECRDLATREVDRARRLAYRPLEAEALAIRANAEGRLNDLANGTNDWYGAWWAAEAGGDTKTKLAAATNLCAIAGVRHQFEDSRMFYEYARAILEGHDNPTSRAHLLVDYALTLANENRCPDAEPMYREAIDLFKRDAEQEQNLRNAEVNYAQCLSRRGKLTEAAALIEPALAWLTKLHGPDTPSAHGWRMVLADLRSTQGRHHEALALVDQTLAIDKKVGAEWRNSAPRLARELTNVGRAAEALVLANESLPIVEAKHGPDSALVVYQLAERVDALHALKRDPESAADRKRLLEITEKQYGRDKSGNAIAQAIEADALAATGRPADAAAIYARLLHAGAFDPTEEVECRSKLGNALLGLNRRAEAIEILEPATKSCGAAELPPFYCAEAAFALARALEKDPSDSERVNSLVQTARIDYGKTDYFEVAPRLAALDAWTSSH